MGKRRAFHVPATQCRTRVSHCCFDTSCSAKPRQIRTRRLGGAAMPWLPGARAGRRPEAPRPCCADRPDGPLRTRVICRSGQRRAWVRARWRCEQSLDHLFLTNRADLGEKDPLMRISRNRPYAHFANEAGTGGVEKGNSEVGIGSAPQSRPWSRQSPVMPGLSVRSRKPRILGQASACARAFASAEPPPRSIPTIVGAQPSPLMSCPASG